MEATQERHTGQSHCGEDGIEQMGGVPRGFEVLSNAEVMALGKDAGLSEMSLVNEALQALSRERDKTWVMVRGLDSASVECKHIHVYARRRGIQIRIKSRHGKFYIQKVASLPMCDFCVSNRPRLATVRILGRFACGYCQRKLKREGE